MAQQRAALRAAGCTRLFEEKASGGRWDRPELRRLLEMGETAAGFRSLTEHIDTTTPAG